MLKVLEADFARLPALLGAPAVVEPPDEQTVEDVTALLGEPEPAVQLGLF
jgi:hypothetical protein